MIVEQKKFTPDQNWISVGQHEVGNSAQLVLVFGPQKLISDPTRFEEIKSDFPEADIVMSSTPFGLMEGQICENEILLTAIQFEKTKVQAVQVNLKDVKDSFDAGMHISAILDKDELCSLLLLTDGTGVNGSHLLTGIHFNLSEIVPVTGGLTDQDGDLAVSGLNQVPGQGNVIGIALHSEYLKVGHACKTGWKAFGPERFVTHSRDNVVYEMDNLSATEVYDRYLGEVDNNERHTPEFPIGIKYDNTDDRLVRGIASVDDESQKIVFDGEVPVGSRVRLMKSNKFNLLDAACEAATNALKSFDIQKPDLAFVVNSSSRKRFLKDWATDEVTAAYEVLGEDIPIAGLYSKAEISPFGPLMKGELHNQSLMITTFKEI